MDIQITTRQGSFNALAFDPVTTITGAIEIPAPMGLTYSEPRKEVRTWSLSILKADLAQLEQVDQPFHVSKAGHQWYIVEKVGNTRPGAKHDTLVQSVRVIGRGAQ